MVSAEWYMFREKWDMVRAKWDIDVPILVQLE